MLLIFEITNVFREISYLQNSLNFSNFVSSISMSISSSSVERTKETTFEALVVVGEGGGGKIVYEVLVESIKDKC
jgi:Ca2+-binding EF-hand superfamily protein